MQLLNARTLRLTTFYNEDVPPYAILSHTWEEEEILFEDIRDPEKPFPIHKKGWSKVKGSCEQALRNNHEWVWIDTCCIDKSSSAELSEAINSMFQWYHKSEVCYAYLSDVTSLSVEFVHSRWFTRGWTLQEMIAPKVLEFYDSKWRCMGERKDQNLAQRIVDATGVPVDLLKSQRPSDPWSNTLRTYLNGYSVAQRFSWASKRSTKRVEDEAYCLLGIFGVNMPLLYGEGSQAFFRLQHEILKTSDDQSILAFKHSMHLNHDLLAESSRDFLMSKDIQPIHHDDFAHALRSASTALTPSAKTLEMSLYLCPPLRPDSQSAFLGVLSCNFGSEHMSRPAMVLEPVNHANPTTEFYRTATRFLTIVNPELRSVVRSYVGTPKLDIPFSIVEDDFDISKAHRRTVRIYFRKPAQIQNISLNSSAFMGVPAISVMTPAVRLNIKGLPARVHGGACIVEARPCSLVPVVGAGESLFYGEPGRGPTGNQESGWKIFFPWATNTPEPWMKIEACGAMIIDMGTSIQSDDSWPPLVVVLWGRNLSNSLSHGSYTCVLLDWTDILNVARMNDELDFTALRGYKGISETDRRVDYRALLSWLMNTCLSNPHEMDATLVGLATLSRPAVLREWWGKYTFELSSEEFMGQPLLDMVLSVEFVHPTPPVRLLHKEVHELEGSEVHFRWHNIWPERDLLHEYIYELQGSIPFRW